MKKSNFITIYRVSILTRNVLILLMWPMMQKWSLDISNQEIICVVFLWQLILERVHSSYNSLLIFRAILSSNLFHIDHTKTLEMWYTMMTVWEYTTLRLTVIWTSQILKSLSYLTGHTMWQPSKKEILDMSLQKIGQI